MMKEFVALETHEICTAVGITTSNLNVMLHRSRLRLRARLDVRRLQEFQPPDPVSQPGHDSLCQGIG